ncbi:hypothetical protein [Lactiplantibacillus plajomi]|uniref:Uncharacterized protein n=1 Tax=Lactiplantibacillus plajomi TaxID=1457217 RepID=A0ABV6K1Z9_9LACO|nr:hypothetical protein [Lactiplantibacillus plajomi]
MNGFKRMARVLPTLWHDRVTISGVREVKDGPFTTTEDVTVCKDRPAKVVLSGLKTSEQSFFGTDAYDAKLIIDNGVKVAAGDLITVTDQNSVVTEYRRASKGYTGYASHQEVAMVRDEKAKEVVNDGLGND